MKIETFLEYYNEYQSLYMYAINMITNTINSRYAAYIFKEIEKQLTKNNTHFLKDPYYLNKRGESRFMISSPDLDTYKKSIDTISEMIGEYINNYENKKLTKKRNSKTTPPSPLNIII